MLPRGRTRASTYHPRVSWLPLVAIAAVVFALALIPTRRLSLAGWRPAWLAAYLVVLVSLALIAIEMRAGIRVLVPIILVLYVAPFIGAPDRVARAISRLGAGRGGSGPTVIDGTARPVADPPAAAGPEAAAPEAPDAAPGPAGAPGGPAAGGGGSDDGTGAAPHSGEPR